MIPCNQLSLADTFQIVRKLTNPTNLSSDLSYSTTLPLMKLSLLPFVSISIHQREDPVNTL